MHKAGKDEDKNGDKYNSAGPYRHVAGGYTRVCRDPIPVDDAPRAGGVSVACVSVGGGLLVACVWAGGGLRADDVLVAVMLPAVSLALFPAFPAPLRASPDHRVSPAVPRVFLVLLRVEILLVFHVDRVAA